MTSIYLIRQGQLAFGSERNAQLSPLGTKQSHQLGEVLANRLGSVDSIYHGGTPAQCLTMDYSLRHFFQLKHNTHQDPCWQDYDIQHVLSCYNPQFSSAAGMQGFLSQQEDPRQAYQQQFNFALQRWMSGEYDNQYQLSWPAFQSRIEQGLANIIEQTQGQKHVLVFTSAGPIALLCQQLLNLPASYFIAFTSMLVNCSVTKLYVSQGKPMLSSVNEHSWFEGQYQHLLSHR